MTSQKLEQSYARQTAHLNKSKGHSLWKETKHKKNTGQSKDVLTRCKRIKSLAKKRGAITCRMVSSEFELTTGIARNTLILMVERNELVVLGRYATVKSVHPQTHYELAGAQCKRRTSVST